MYQDFAEYAGIYKLWKRHPKKHAYDLFVTNAKGVSRMGKCCFGLCCMCGCCCMTGPYLNMVDVGHNWVDALEVYKDVDRKKTDELFEKGMAIMCKVQAAYKTALDNLDKELKTSLQLGTMEKYQTLKFQYTIMLCNVGADSWFSTLIEFIYDNIREFAPNLKYITLTNDEISTLEACLPFFYPATQKKSNYALKMNEKVLHMLKTRM